MPDRCVFSRRRLITKGEYWLLWEGGTIQTEKVSLTHGCHKEELSFSSLESNQKHVKQEKNSKESVHDECGW